MYKCIEEIIEKEIYDKEEIINIITNTEKYYNEIALQINSKDVDDVIEEIKLVIDNNEELYNIIKK